MTSTSTSTTPTLNTKLLLQTADAIEYADRFDLNVWAAFRQGGHADTDSNGLYYKCDAVGCVAGWVAAVKAPKSRPVGNDEICGYAQDALGLTVEQRYELFTPGAMNNDDLLHSVWRMADPYRATAKQAAKVLRELAAGKRTFACDRTENAS